MWGGTVRGRNFLGRDSLRSIFFVKRGNLRGGTRTKVIFLIILVKNSVALLSMCSIEAPINFSMETIISGKFVG